MTQLALSVHNALTTEERQKQFATIMAAAAFCAFAVKAMAGFGPISQARPVEWRLHATSAVTAMGVRESTHLGPPSSRQWV